MATAVRLLLALTLAAGLASCGGDDSSSPPRLDPAVAARLASASDDVAAALEQGRCPRTSLRELERSASDDGVPTAVRREVRRVVDRADVTCLQVAPPPVSIPTVQNEGDEDDAGKGKGRGHDKKEKKHKKHGHGGKQDRGDD
jgi:hypothetical protein